MKKVVLLFLFAAIAISSASAQSDGLTMTEKSDKPAKAVKSGESEMKTYVMVFLVEGENRNHSKKEAEKIQKQHLEHLTSMHEEGILLMAGPFMDKQTIKGILVMKASEIDEIKDRVEKDPAIEAGRLKAEYHLWYTKSGTVVLP